MQAQPRLEPVGGGGGGRRRGLQCCLWSFVWLVVDGWFCQWRSLTTHHDPNTAYQHIHTYTELWVEAEAAITATTIKTHTHTRSLKHPNNTDLRVEAEAAPQDTAPAGASFLMAAGVDH